MRRKTVSCILLIVFIIFIQSGCFEKTNNQEKPSVYIENKGSYKTIQEAIDAAENDDTIHVLNNVLLVETHLVWYKCNDLSDYDAVILPGGFSYGDRLRAGIIAAHSPVMKAVKNLAKDGKPVLGICNGFQILVESGLLPGALLRNSSLKFICKWINLSLVSEKSVFTKKGMNNIIKMPIA